MIFHTQWALSSKDSEHRHDLDMHCPVMATSHLWSLRVTDLGAGLWPSTKTVHSPHGAFRSVTQLCC